MQEALVELTLRRAIASLGTLPHPAIGKAAAVVYASYGYTEHQEVVAAASRLRDNYLADFNSMLDLALAYRKVPERFRTRRDTIFDPISRTRRLDIRRLLVLRLLGLNMTTAVRYWIDDAKKSILKQRLSR